MKFFSKKSDQESLKTLNEREIQERLYGKYHADSPKAPAVRSVNTATLPKIEIKNRLEPSFASQPSPKVTTLSLSAPIIKFVKNFQWKFSGIVLASLVAGIFALQFLSSWMETLKKEPERVHIQKAVEVSSPAPTVKITKASIPDIKPEEAVKAIQPVAEAKPVVPKTLDIPKKKYFAVQVCTYFQESDARTLTEKLKNLNFSAFYQRVSSNTQNTTYYLVFLGKEDTQSAAQAHLQAFKRSPEFQNFPDSFVRSV